MSLRPGIAEGSFASPLRKARRKLTNGKCLSSTVTTSNPFDNLVVMGSGSDKGRSASGGGNSRRKVSVTILLPGRRFGGATISARAQGRQLARRELDRLAAEVPALEAPRAEPARPVA